jgi:hypothetical protein
MTSLIWLLGIHLGYGLGGERQSWELVSIEENFLVLRRVSGSKLGKEVGRFYADFGRSFMKLGRILFAVVAFAVLVGTVAPANAAVRHHHRHHHRR